LPKLKKERTFSLGWAFAKKDGDDMIELVNLLAKGAKVKDVVDYVDSLSGGFNGLPQNGLFADNAGDIAFIMLCPNPIRKDQTPLIGSRVLDGRSSAYDWMGLVPGKDLPRSVNPERGYIVTANNRQVPENSLYDYGAGNGPTGRSKRIDEVIRKQIASGKKFSLKDVGAI